MAADFLCTHCERSYPRQELKPIVALMDVTCCDECADVLLEGGKVLMCSACSNLADADVRAILPAGAAARLRELSEMFASLSLSVHAALTEFEKTEDEQALLQCLHGGTQMEAEAAAARVRQKGPLLAGEFQNLADVYARLAGLRSV